LSREQSGFKWLLKTIAEAIVIKTLSNNEVRGNSKQKLSGRRSVLTLPACRRWLPEFSSFVLRRPHEHFYK
jgi:hypothetical protein